MIVSFTGTPGSGKSYHAVYYIYERLKYGHLVVTNILLDTSLLTEKEKQAYRYYDVHDITPKLLCQISQELKETKKWKRVPEDYITLVIDEAQLVFNCREWNKVGRDGWIEFFTQHRKLGYYVILVCQMQKMLDNQIRGILEYDIIHRKFSSYGLKGLIVSLCFLSLTMISCVRVWSPLNERIDAEYLRYSKRIGRLYDTCTLFEK